MTKRKNNFDKDNYKYLASGSFKDVFKRKPGFKPVSKRRGKNFPQNKTYISAFFIFKEDPETEIKALQSMKLVDPLEIFTIQLVEVRDLQKEPRRARVALQEHLIVQVPEEWKRDHPYLFEIIFPFGGISYKAELMNRKECNMRDFIFPILLLIFCIGYMNECGYFHMDIKDANILYNDSQLFLIDFSLLTKDCKLDYNFVLYFDEKEVGTDKELNLTVNFPPESNYFSMLGDLGLSKNLKRQGEKYKQVDLTLKDWLIWVNKYVPEIYKDHMFYLKQLKKLERFSPERFVIDREYKDLLVNRMKVRDKIYLDCYEKYKGPDGEIIYDDTLLKCLKSAMDNFQDIFLLYADRYDSYRLGSTVLSWIRTFRKKFYHHLDKVDKHIFDSFALSVYEHLCAFNVRHRMNLTDFHKHFLRQVRFFGYRHFLQEYKHYCSKIYKKREDRVESDENIKESVRSEKLYFKNLFSNLDLLMD